MLCSGKVHTGKLRSYCRLCTGKKKQLWPLTHWYLKNTHILKTELSNRFFRQIWIILEMKHSSFHNILCQMWNQSITVNNDDWDSCHLESPGFNELKVMRAQRNLWDLIKTLKLCHFAIIVEFHKPMFMLPVMEDHLFWETNSSSRRLTPVPLWLYHTSSTTPCSYFINII